MKARLMWMFIVVLLGAAFTDAQARSANPPYLRIGADPMGSYTLKTGEFWDTIPNALWVTTRGGSGKWYSGMIPAEQEVAAREVSRRDYTGYYISVREVVAIRVCGNITRPTQYEKTIAKPVPPPPKPEVRIEKQYISGPIQIVQVPGPERIVTLLAYPALPPNRVPDVQAQSYIVSHAGIGTALIRAIGQVLGAPRLEVNQVQTAPANLTAIGTGNASAAADASAAATAAAENTSGTTVVVSE